MPNRSIQALGILLCSAISGQLVRAEGAVELVVNGSFENTAASFVSDGRGVMPLAPGSGAIPGWSIIDAEVIWGDDINDFGPTTPFGEFGLDLTGYHDSQPFGGVQQTIATTPRASYRMSVALGTYNALWFGQVAVELRAGTTSEELVGEDWKIYAMEFTATEAETVISVRGTISQVTLSGGEVYLGIDRVSVICLTPFEAAYSAWRRSYFGDIDSPEGEIGANPEHDCRNNLYEFAFHLDPTKPDASSLPSPREGAVAGERRMAIQFVRRKDLGTYKLRASVDLLTWSDVSGVLLEPPVEVAPNYERVLITDEVALGGSLHPRRFLRIEVSFP